ncbi:MULTISPECIES: hypothetical protein [unclassified Streptomyces]|uniref:hypothetical protein n=1 Tax=unclassified Streptomyces TaxID=2593676 RepID=UPI00332D820A
MTRPTRVLPVLLLAPLLLTACGSEKAGADPATGSPAGTAQAAGPTSSSSASTTEAAGQGELDARAQAMGIAPELVYVTESPGFTLAQQSVGALGDDGFSAAYTAVSGAVVNIMVERGSMTEETCRSQPVGLTSGERTTCDPDAGTFYRTGGGRHEYALPKNGHVVKVSADTDDVSREILRGAAASVHRPDAAEAAVTLPSPKPVTTPVERGDLPPFGDGAPDNSVDVGG